MPKLERGKTWQTRPVHTATAVVAAAYKIRPPDLRKNGTREHWCSHPRQVVMWLAVELGAGTGHVRRYMGFADHTTVVHACKRVEQRRAADAKFAALCAALLDQAREYPGGKSAILRDGAHELGKSQPTTDNNSVHRSIAS